MSATATMHRTIATNRATRRTIRSLRATARTSCLGPPIEFALLVFHVRRFRRNTKALGAERLATASDEDGWSAPTPFPDAPPPPEEGAAPLRPASEPRAAHPADRP